MKGLNRRSFLASLAASLASAYSARGAALPRLMPGGQSSATQPGKDTACWLDVAAPFIVHEPKLGLSTELLLTATCFPGQDGFRDSQSGTEYEVDLYDAGGKQVSLGHSGRLSISPMRPTVLRMDELLEGKSLWGSARIRVAPRGKQIKHAGDLFSAGFVRWYLPSNFDNVHAHPAAPKQARGRFFYSMPFPPLREYHCPFVLFNPNEDPSQGTVRVLDRLGRTVVERSYKLNPRQTVLYSLENLKTADSPAEALVPAAVPEKLREGGVVVVTNDSEAVAFAYTLMIGRGQRKVFSVEHPLHFTAQPVQPARKSPFDSKGNFAAEALLYTPLLFTGRRFGGVDLESCVYLSASQWREDALWLMPFASDSQGLIPWVSTRDERLPQRVQPAEVAQEGVFRLGVFQSCQLEGRSLPLAEGFSGSFGVATAPPTSHSLMKVEVRATNWGRAAFTHFRPGGQAHRRYREVAERGGLATDYIVSGCQVRGTAEDRRYDALLAVMNIEFAADTVGTPRIQLFGPAGLVAEKALGEFPPLACRHFLLSALFPELQTEPGRPLSVRLLDAKAMIVTSVLHIDYERRDIAIDHGSDRHSTYLDYGC